MFIQTESTPNPNAIKFIPGGVVSPAGTFDYRDVDAAVKSPLAQRLFKITGVAGVYLGADFVSVTKVDSQDWAVLKPRILASIMDHFLSGLPVVETDGVSAHKLDAQQSDIVAQICTLLDERVRPAVAQDGGDIVFDRFEDGIVYLHMRGACSGCPSSTATLKHGIENMLKHFLPEIQEVRAA
jgi:Fe-S cluster biogenesis protein NfuA